MCLSKKKKKKKTMNFFSYKEKSHRSGTKNKKQEKRIKYIRVNFISPQPKKKKIILNKECRERRTICKHTLPQFRLIGEDDEKSTKVMKLLLDDSRLSFWWECPFSSSTSTFLCKLQ
jgi:hypothetical protein